MNNKVFSSQDEGCQRSKEASLNHKAAQQVKKQGLDLQKMEILKRFWAKEGWCSGIRATRAL
jgi:hypothetical protein